MADRLSATPTLVPTALPLLDAVTLPLWVFDIERSSMVWANRAALELWQATDVNELCRRYFGDMSEVTAERLRGYLERFSGGETVVEQWTFYPRGQAVTAECVCSGVRLPGGRLAMLVQAELPDQGRVSVDTVRALEALRHTSTLISLFTREGALLFQNPAAQRAYGSGRDLNGFRIRFADSAAAAKAWEAIETGGSCCGEYRIRTAEGVRWHHVACRLTEDPASGDGGRLLLVNEQDVTARVHAEEDLRGSEERYRQLFMRNKAIGLLLDPNSGRIVDANAAAARFYGWSIDELRSMTIDRINCLSGEQVKAEMASARAERRDHFLFRHRLASGDVRDVEVHSGPVEIHGRMLLYSIIHDVTDRSAAESALQASEWLYRSVINNTREGFWMIDGRRCTIEVNDALCALVGYRREEMLGRPPVEFVDEDNRAIFEREMARIADTEHRRYEIALRRRDGSKVRTYFSTTTLRDEEGRLVGAFAFVSDLTDHYRAQETLRQSEERFRSAFEHSASGMAISDLDGRLISANSAFGEMLGYRPDEVVGRRVEALTEPADYLREQRLLEQVRGGEREYFRLEKRYLHRDGHRVWGALTVAAVRDAEGRPLHFIGQVEDITERKLAETRLLTLSRALEHSGSAVVIVDAAGRVEYVNPRFVEINGRDAAELVGRPISELHYEANSGDGHIGLESLLAGRREWRGELRNRRADGTRAWCLASISPIEDEEGQVGHFVVVSEDVSALKEAQARAERLCFYDALTGLANRRLFQDRLAQALKTVEREGTEAALLFLDLDHFKDINDSMGHDSGDRLLIQVAERLEGAVREEDTVSRLGGDEFTVILRRVAGAEGAAVAARKLLAVLGEPSTIDGCPVVAGGSIGITMIPSDGTDVETLLKNADMAMYRAKASGRHCYAFYTTELNEAVGRRMELEAELRRAMDNREFTLNFQPQIDLGSNRLIGFEALLRWQHPVRGEVLPDEFIPAAEESGLIVPLGAWVLEAGCRQLRALHDAGATGLTLSVNISPRQFLDDALVETVRGALAAAGLSPASLELELTESTVMDDVDSASRILRRLKELGVALAVDDFGTGYSSLASLKRFPIDTLKIDRSFVQDIPGDSNDVAITAAILAMAHSMGLRVVAEGVETASQREFLMTSRCESAQGFLFSRALPPANLQEWIGGWSH